ncbi:hypothetical protein IAU59_002244 [Kwoniella sp. CBS 9459]
MMLTIQFITIMLPIFFGLMRQAASSPAPIAVPAPAAPTITAAPAQLVSREQTDDQKVNPVFADDTTMTLFMTGMDQQGLYIHNSDGAYSSQDLGAFMPKIEYKFDKDHRSEIFTAAFYDADKVKQAIAGPSMSDTAAKAEWFKTADRYTYTKEVPTKLFECTARATEVRQNIQVSMTLREADLPSRRRQRKRTWWSIVTKSSSELIAGSCSMMTVLLESSADSRSAIVIAFR